MEKRIIKKPIKITTDSFKDVEVFFAKDGKEFTNENECKNYEHKLELNEKVDLITEFKHIKLNYSTDQLITRIIEGSGYITDINIFSWMPSNAGNVLKEFEVIADYLRAVYGFKIHDDNFKDFKL